MDSRNFRLATRIDYDQSVPLNPVSSFRGPLIVQRLLQQSNFVFRKLKTSCHQIGVSKQAFNHLEAPVGVTLRS